MGVTVLHNLQEFQEFINKNKKVVIDFWATWCGPCKVISPVFEKLASTTEGVAFAKVDVDAASDIAEECAIRAMPTFKFFNDGKPFDEVIGANVPNLNQKLQALVAA